MCQKLINISSLTCCRVHTWLCLWLCSSPLYMHTRCYCLVYLCTTKRLFRLTINKYYSNWLHCQIFGLTFLYFLFICCTLLTFATIICVFADNYFVITVLTATNSVLVFCTCWYLYLVFWCCKRVDVREKVSRANQHLRQYCQNQSGKITLPLQFLQDLQLTT